MTRLTVTVDDQGRLTLPDEVARTLHAGQRLVIELTQEQDAAPVSTRPPLASLVGSLPPLPTDSRTYYRQQRGHDQQGE